MIVRKFALMLLSLLLVGALLEAGLRVIDYDPNPSPLWRYDSTLGWRWDTRSGQIEGVNSSGFRFRPVSAEKPAGQGRILVLGDSFTAGLGLPYEDTLPGRLEAWLGHEKKDWHVISLAVDDWGNAQELLALEEFGFAFRPDAVVLQTFPFNDFCNDCRVLADTCSLQDLHRPYLVEQNGRLVRFDIHPWRSLLRSHFLLFGLVENAFEKQVGSLPADFLPEESNQDLRRRAYFRSQARSRGLEFEGAVYSITGETKQPPEIRECWETTEAILRSIKEATDRAGIPLVALVIPFLKSFPEEWDSLAEVLDAPIERDYDTGRFEDIFKRLAVPAIPVRSRIAESDLSYLDYFLSPQDGHLSGLGHAECASWLLTTLQPYLGLSHPGPEVELIDSDLVHGSAGWSVACRGLGPLPDGLQGWRSGFGPAIELDFRNGRFPRVLLTLELEAVQTRIVARLLANGFEMARSPALNPGSMWNFEGPLELLKGPNSIRIQLDPDSNAQVPTAGPLRVRFHRLDLFGMRDTVGHEFPKKARAMATLLEGRPSAE